MDQQRKNKEFIINYLNALSGVAKQERLWKSILQMKL
jgi:hypothetical protein